MPEAILKTFSAVEVSVIGTLQTVWLITMYVFSLFHDEAQTALFKDPVRTAQ